jgi:hypothetical protein
VATVTADVSAITTGSTSVTLTAGSFTAGGVSCGYRSKALTANAVLSSGSKTFSIMAIDVAGNTTTQGDFTVTVDNTAPTATDIQTTNVGGGTIGLPETEIRSSTRSASPWTPAPSLAAWNGSATSVTLHLNNTPAGDSVTIFNAANTTQLPLGVADIGKKNYTSASVVFTGSTMVMSGSTITVTLGTPGGTGARIGNVANIVWTPSAVATDRAGKACSTATATQSGPARRAF